MPYKADNAVQHASGCFTRFTLPTWTDDPPTPPAPEKGDAWEPPESELPPDWLAFPPPAEPAEVEEVDEAAEEVEVEPLAYDYIAFEGDPPRHPVPNFWSEMHAADVQQFLSPGPRLPEPCLWCHRWSAHHPECPSLSEAWQVLMPFGKHRGTPIRDVPAEYLAWFARTCGPRLTSDIRHEVERVSGIVIHVFEEAD